MSIQNTESSERVITTGTKIAKIMLKGSEGMVLDLLQKTQYVKPIESTVRELTTNAVDAQSEKNMAIRILNGESKVEDYFVEKEEMDSDKYAYSKWNPKYYDLKHLSSDNNVNLTYLENTETSFGFCDKFIVEDFGVGLSAERLYLTIGVGQSTKRLTKELLGAYGFGAKAAISTDCVYYDITSYYNGKRFHVRCFEKHIEDLTPVRAEDFSFNPSEEVEGVTFRYTLTDRKNGVVIEVPVRRLAKRKYIDAVNEQLLYFKDVNFYVISNGISKKEDIKATVYYETDYLVISDQPTYNKPHILITSDPKRRNSNMVCYGYIDFEELEKPEIYSSIGIKCPIYSETIGPITGDLVIHEGVTVIPSREAVRQGDFATRTFISKVFTDYVVKEANEYVQQKLSVETDFLKWLQAMTSIVSYSNFSDEGTKEEKIFKAFRSLIDFSLLSGVFGNTGIRFTNQFEKFFDGLMFTKVFSSGRKQTYLPKANKNVYTENIGRDVVTRWGELQLNSFFYFKNEGVAHNNKRDKYLHSIRGDFYTVTHIPKGLTKASIEFLNYKGTSKDNFLEYEEIEIPEGFTSQYEEEEEILALDVEMKAEKQLTPEERRNKYDLILLTTFRPQKYYDYTSYDTKLMYWGENTKVEVKKQDAAHFGGKLYYVLADEVFYMELIYVFCKARVEKTLQYYNEETQFFSDEKKFVKVSQKNLELIPNAVHVSQFFNAIENETFTMDEDMIKWNTARIIHGSLKTLMFMENFSHISEKYFEKYQTIKKYSKEHYWENSPELLNKSNGKKLLGEFIDTLDKLLEMQEAVQDLEQEQLEKVLAEKFQNNFGIKDAKVVDYNVILILRELLDFADNISTLLNRVNVLVGTYSPNQQEIFAIKQYIKTQKNISL